MQKINLEAAFGSFQERWSPRVLASLNGQEVKLAKLQGDFVWHHHADADELFWVVRGRLTLRLREEAGERAVTLGPGELLVVPRGVEHQPVAEEETWLVLFEPAGTLNTGNVENERTVRAPARL